MKNLSNKYYGDTGYGECGTGGNFRLTPAADTQEGRRGGKEWGRPHAAAHLSKTLK